MNTKIPKVAIFFIAAVLVAISSVSAVDDKCAACNAVAVINSISSDSFCLLIDFVIVVLEFVCI